MNTKQIITAYIHALEYRPATTRKTYTQGLKVYIKTVGVDAPINLQTYIKFLKSLSPYPASTQHVYHNAALGLYKFYCLEYDETVNLIAMKEAVKVYLKKGSSKLHFDRDNVSVLVEYAESMKYSSDDPDTELRNLRDKAFILLCVDSGLRISEACALKRGQVPWEKKYIYIIGKGAKEERIRFSDRALRAIKQYLHKRAAMDGATGQPLDSMPLFARHDRGGGRRVKPVHSGGMWSAFVGHMRKAGIEKGAISPHKLRHEAITHMFETSNNIKTTMEFSRHSRMDTVNKYTHLVDRVVDDAYEKAFNKR